MCLTDKQDFNRRLANFLHGTIQNSGTFSASVIESNLILFDRFEQDRLDRAEAQKQAENDRLDAIIRQQRHDHRVWLHRNLPDGVVLSENEQHGPWQVVLYFLDGPTDGWYITNTQAIMVEIGKGKPKQFVKIAGNKRKGGLAKAILECRKRNLKLGYEANPENWEVAVRS